MSELNDCMEALEQIGRREIRKSLEKKPVSAKVEKAMAISAGTRTPEGAVLARRIFQLERQRSVQKAMGMFAPPADSGRKPASLKNASTAAIFKELNRRGYDITEA